MPITDTLTTPPQSPAGSEKGFKQRKLKTSKKTPKELHDICSRIHDPTMNDLKDLLPDMFDAVYCPHDNRLKRQNKWQSKPAGYPEDVPLYSPGNYIPNEKRKPRKVDLMPQYNHLRQEIAEMVASMGEDLLQKVEPDSFPVHKASIPLTSEMLSTVREEIIPPSQGQGERQGQGQPTVQETSPTSQDGGYCIILTSQSGSIFSYRHEEEMETENFTVSSQQTTASPISFTEQDLSVDDIFQGVIEMEEEYGKHDQRKFKVSGMNVPLCISGTAYEPFSPDHKTTNYSDQVTIRALDPEPVDAVIPTTVMQFSETQGQGDFAMELDTGQGAPISPLQMREVIAHDNGDLLFNLMEQSDILPDIKME